MDIVISVIMAARIPSFVKTKRARSGRKPSIFFPKSGSANGMSPATTRTSSVTRRLVTYRLISESTNAAMESPSLSLAFSQNFISQPPFYRWQCELAFSYNFCVQKETDLNGLPAGATMAGTFELEDSSFPNVLAGSALCGIFRALDNKKALPTQLIYRLPRGAGAGAGGGATTCFGCGSSTCTAHFDAAIDA